MAEEDQKKSSVRVIIHSFFVIPFLIAIFAVLVFFLWKLLTYEPKTAEEYLADIKIGSATKRWQSAYELAKLLAVPNKIPKSQRFVEEMIATYQYTRDYDPDPRVRRYLATAMGVTGNARFSETLRNALQDSDIDVVVSATSALGLLRRREDVDLFLQLASHESERVRLEAVIALGNIGDRRAIGLLKARLNDSEPRIQWISAASLARMGDSSGHQVLLNLLSRNYLMNFTNKEEQSRIMIIAIHSAALLHDSTLNQAIKHLSETDEDMKVRDAAIKAFRNSPSKAGKT